MNSTDNRDEGQEPQSDSAHTPFGDELTGVTRERVEQWLSACQRWNQRRADHWAPPEPTPTSAAREAGAMLDLLARACAS